MMLVRSFHAASFFNSFGHHLHLRNLPHVSECRFTTRSFSPLGYHFVRKYSTKLLSARIGSLNKSQKERRSGSVSHASLKLTGDRSNRPSRSAGKFNDVKPISRLDFRKTKPSLNAKYGEEPGRLVRNTESSRKQGSISHSSQKGIGERLSRSLRSEGNFSDEETSSRSDTHRRKQSLPGKHEYQPSRNPVTTTEPLDFSRKDKKTTNKLQSQVKGKVNTEQNSNESRKRGKRVMRLDPKDNTSKRFSRGYPCPGEEDVDLEEKIVEVKGRAQFRAIIPQTKLMQHIENHLIGRRRPSELQRAGYDLNITPAPLDNVPYSKKGERQPTQEEVFRHKLRFTASAKVASSFPPCEIPEVAFAGRSNVGKSSLINALTRQWGVARTSDKPGLTQSINFFRLGGRICLVDLPGYGFAYAKEEKKESWEELVREFVTTRVGLKRVYLLVDSKWGLKLRDEELIELMERAGTKYQIVLTKSDTVSPLDLGRRATQIQELLKKNKSLVLPTIMVSSKTGEGLEFFRGYMAKLAKASLI